ncbi:dsRBD fold-containing protein [Rhodococcus opacus]|uniref:DUF1876 domain-containing protein n=1 Tax=Rhodococcus opacus TaxID=37919 RepID=A0A2S8IJV0_RHOOP|nr:dsRBD fold-containing protein [Rhodococcus opacus]PQP15048.1 DUF1876 domain-containing protein [Rhodococcus opacus]
MSEKTWSVKIVIDEHKSDETGTKTRARALLRVSGRTTFLGTGLARRIPQHTDVTEVTVGMAAAHQLHEAAAKREAATRSVLNSARIAEVAVPRLEATRAARYDRTTSRSRR